MQQRDTYTTVDELLADDSFRRWIRQQDHTPGWEEWVRVNPQRAKLVEEARMWVLAMHVPQPILTAGESQTALQQTWTKIRRLEEKPTPVIRLWANRRWQAVAAVLAVAVLFGWLYTTQTPPNRPAITYNELIKQNPAGLIEQTNHSDKPQLITLSDGSSVLLDPHSKLSYPKTFAPSERIVYLSGEGFFEISKNPQRPFYVYANEIVTKVVGTSFRIKAYADQPNVEVFVRTGKVSVQANGQSESGSQKGMLLLPNQSIRYVRDEHSFDQLPDITADAAPATAQPLIEQESFEFTDAPVGQILETLERAYLVEIDYPKQALKDCYLTSSLSDQPLPEKLKIICESLGNHTRYEMNGNRIIITSSGCN